MSGRRADIRHTGGRCTDIRHTPLKCYHLSIPEQASLQRYYQYLTAKDISLVATKKKGLIRVGLDYIAFEVTYLLIRTE